MPLTFAHPAAVLPFSRDSKYINFLAMVLGSMSPDFEYFLRGMPSGEIGHTFVGFVTFNLPIVVIVYFIYQTFIHRTLVSHLPLSLQSTFTPKTNSTTLLKVVVFLYSTLFGMLTHVVWDSFTHVNGFIVEKFSILTYNVVIFDFHIPFFKFLQHGGTIVGITAILLFMYVRAARSKGYPESNIESKQKWMYWGQISLLTMCLVCFWCLIDQVSVGAYGILVVRIIDSALISLFIVSICFNRSFGRKRKGSIWG